jgi:RHS repeat-associated protein
LQIPLRLLLAALLLFLSMPSGGNHSPAVAASQPLTGGPIALPPQVVAQQVHRAASGPANLRARVSLLPAPLAAVAARLVAPVQAHPTRTFTWTLRGQPTQPLPLALLDLAGCWSDDEVARVVARAAGGHNLPVRLAQGHLLLAHIRAADWPVTLTLTFTSARIMRAEGVRMTVRAGAALLLPRAQRAGAVTVEALPGPACGAGDGMAPAPVLQAGHAAAHVSLALPAPAAAPPPLALPAGPAHPARLTGQAMLPPAQDASLAPLRIAGDTQPVTFTFSLQAGWNLISLPLSPTAGLDAHTVLSQLLAATHGGYAELDGYTNGRFMPSMYDDVVDGLGFGGTNFTLQLGSGYALYSDLAGNLTVTGGPATSQPLTLAAGWNLAGFPNAAITQTQAYSLLTTLLVQTGGRYAEIDGYSNGRFTPSAFDDPGDHLGLGGADFTMQPGQGYAIYTDLPAQLGTSTGTPAAPTAVTGAPADGQVTLFWAIPASDGGHPITGYKIYVSDGSIVDVGSAATSAVVGGLTDGVAYTFAVSAVNAAGEGPRSAPSVPITPFALPPDPSTVAPPVDTTVATNVYSSTNFLYAGSNAIQTGVVPGTITLTRTAVLRGEVLDRNGDPLAGATITVLNHQEFGQTVSRADGMYDLVVNGGGLLTLTYTAQGYLAAQRQVQAPWQDYAQVSNVALVPYDPHINTVDTSGGTEQVAQGGMEQDADGARQATLLFAPGTSATMNMPDGSTQPLPGPWHVRATEFTVGAMGPAAMPGQLPASSGYTYAADFSVDEAVAAGATGVQFSQPVALYVQNFLGFPVGVHVPTGHYDRTTGQWVAVNDGRVVKILSISDGAAVLDVDGSGNPATTAELQALGITSTELATLAQTYANAVGQSFWRVAITHFSPSDCNWPSGPPQGSPAPPGAPGPNRPGDPKGPCQNKGSIIGCQDQTLGEEVPIAGTPFTLHYTSDRAPGHAGAYSLHIQIVGDSIPPEIKRVELLISVAGRTFSKVWQAADLSPLQQYTFTWDGHDAYGRIVQGPQDYTYDLAYVYPAVYQDPAQLQSTFAAYSGTPMTKVSSIGSDFTGREWYIHALGKGTLGTFAEVGSGLGGWTPDILNHYDPNQHVLYLGDGTKRDVSSLAPVAIEQPTSFPAGLYTCLSPCEGSQFAPISAAYAPDGTLYYVDGDSVVQRLPDGTESIIAGRGLPAPADGLGDNGPALQARFDYPTGIALGRDGSIYIADAYHGRVRRFTPGGAITTVAGGGHPTDGIGDNGPATQAALTWPWGVAVGPDGSLYIADAGMCRVRRVGPDGTISTVAGTDLPNPYLPGLCAGFSGDNGPAVKAELNQPQNVAVGPDGSIYIDDFMNNRVRRIGPNGIITTIAGTGVCNLSSPDYGSPALQANLCLEGGLAVGPDGIVYLATEQGGTLIDAVYPNGTLERVAGTADTVHGCTYDDPGCNHNTPAANMQLGYVYGVTLAPDGTIEVCDDSARILFNISSTLPSLGAANDYIASDDGRQIYAFDASGRHLATLDALTNAVIYTFQYDANGALTQIIDGSGNVTTIERDALGNPTAIVAPGGQRTTLTTDANGYLASVTDPLGHATRMTTSADGLLASFTTPNGALHQFTYDAQGLLIKDQGPDGVSTALARVVGTGSYTVTLTTALGNTTSYVVARLADGSSQQTRIDPGGAHTVITYGIDGTQTALYPDGSKAVIYQSPDPRWGMMAPVASTIIFTTPSGKTTTITNSRTASLSTPGDPLSLTSLRVTSSRGGATTSTTYTAASRTISISTAAGRAGTSTLDSLGRVVSWQPDAGVSPITYSYDALGRLIKAQEGSQFETYTYDAVNELTSRTNAAGQAWQYGYDADGNLTSLTLPGGEIYRLSYDADGNQTSITMPNGAIHTLQYTAFDDPATYTPPGSAAGFAHTYDADGRLATSTLPDGRVSTRGYDAAGRPTTLQYPEATINYSYTANNTTDPISALLRTPTSIGTAETVGFGYDGSLVTSSSLSGAAVGQFTYGYDTNLALNAMTLQSGSDSVSIPVGHDADGLLTGLGSLAMARNGPAGLQSGVTDGSVMSISETYDGLGELTGRQQLVQGTVTLNDTYTYDAAGRTSQIMEQVGGVSHTYAYTYDADGQLTAVTEDGVTIEQYTYDQDGNRTGKVLGGGVPETATFDNRDRLQTRGGTGYTFDASGFMTGRGGDTFTYSARGELLQATVGGKTVTYSYDGLGRRVSRTDSGGTTQYLYGNPTDPLQVSAVRDAAGVLTVLYYDAADMLVAFDRGGSRYYVATDAVGTPRVVTDATGTVVKTLTYSSYGDLLADSAPAFMLPIGFAGGLQDAVTGLVHFGFRDYEPAAGRWTAIDPALYDAEQGNLYAYAQNDPVDFRDPTGLWCFGGSAYEGIGGGAQVCIDDKGFSICAELGFGFGESFEANPLGTMADTGVSTIGELQFNYGLGSISTAVTLTPCGSTPLGQQSSKIQLDAKLTVLGQGVKDSTVIDSDGNVQPSTGDFSLNKFGLDSVGKMGFEGKLADQACSNLPWGYLN